MIMYSTFIPNVENCDIFNEFDYLFGCECDEEMTTCSVNGKECPVTLQ